MDPLDRYRTNIILYGYGFVGEALYDTFKDDVDIRVIDPNKDTPLVSRIKVNHSTILAAFICVGTPTIDGEADDTNIRAALDDIVEKRNGKYLPVAIKSTITPDKLVAIEKDYPNLGIVYNPEFLRQEHHLRDFATMTSTIIGTNDDVAERIIIEIYKEVFGTPFQIHDTDLVTASLIKYTINTFLATKVTFFNEIKQIYDKLDTEIEWEWIAYLLGSDDRIGKTHMQAPGRDGTFGWAGACFPKDTEAFANYAESLNVPVTVLQTAMETNTLHRLKGKAE